MKTNLIIGSEELASKILFTKLPAARLIPDNSAKMYFISARLSDYCGHISQLWVWAVKTGQSSYVGLIFNSGIISDGDNEITSGVFVNFDENDILTEEDENLNKREIHLGATLRIDSNGKQNLELVCYPDNLSAEKVLKAQNHDLKLRGGVFMIKIGEPKQMKTFWVIADEQNNYRGISPFDGEEITLPHDFPFYMIKLGDHAGKGYYLQIRAGKFVLTRKKTA